MLCSITGFVLSILFVDAVDLRVTKRAPYSELRELGKGAVHKLVGSLDVPLVITDAPKFKCQEQGWIEKVAESCPDSLIQHMEMGGKGFGGLKPKGGTRFKDFVTALLQKRFKRPVFGFDFTVPQQCNTKVANDGFAELDIFGVPSERLIKKQQLFFYPGLYISTAGMETVAHVDTDYAAFWTRTCTGRKVWRVISRSQLSQHWESGGFAKWCKAGPAFGRAKSGLLADYGCRKVPFNIHNDTALASELPADLHVWEADVGPDDILFVPHGSLHAAVTTEDTVMLVRNYIDASPVAASNSLDLWEATCSKGDTRSTARQMNVFAPNCDLLVRLLKKQAAKGEKMNSTSKKKSGKKKMKAASDATDLSDEL